jgi:hypothetical protein
MCLRHGCMGWQVLLSALRHADGREMKVSVWQAFRVLVVEVTFKMYVTGEARTTARLPCHVLPRLPLSTKSLHPSRTTAYPHIAISAFGHNRRWIINADCYSGRYAEQITPLVLGGADRVPWSAVLRDLRLLDSAGCHWPRPSRDLTRPSETPTLR